jgi:magnesium transporter
MRDLLFNDPRHAHRDVMMKDPFSLSPDLKVNEAMKLTLNRTIRLSVADAERRLVGLIRGAALFEIEAFEITAQTRLDGGVEKEERVATSLTQSFKFRNPGSSSTWSRRSPPAASWCSSRARWTGS